MTHAIWRGVQFLLGGFGALLMAALTISPAVALENLADWFYVLRVYDVSIGLRRAAREGPSLPVPPSSPGVSSLTPDGAANPYWIAYYVSIVLVLCVIALLIFGISRAALRKR